jgi:hypothetical protein
VFLGKRLGVSRYLGLVRASLAVQSIWRGRSARKLATRISAARLIQAHVRGWRDRRRLAEARRLREVRRAAAVVIQSRWRGWAGRRQFCSQREATIAIQAHFRKWRAMRHLSLARNAAVKIQVNA